MKNNSTVDLIFDFGVGRYCRSLRSRKVQVGTGDCLLRPRLPPRWSCVDRGGSVLTGIRCKDKSPCLYLETLSVDLCDAQSLEWRRDQMFDRSDRRINFWFTYCPCPTMLPEISDNKSFAILVLRMIFRSELQQLSKNLWLWNSFYCLLWLKEEFQFWFTVTYFNSWTTYDKVIFSQRFLDVSQFLNMFVSYSSTVNEVFNRLLSSLCVHVCV